MFISRMYNLLYMKKSNGLQEKIEHSYQSFLWYLEANMESNKPDWYIIIIFFINAGFGEKTKLFYKHLHYLVNTNGTLISP